jgi:hypothetical protein
MASTPRSMPRRDNVVNSSIAVSDGDSEADRCGCRDEVFSNVVGGTCGCDTRTDATAWRDIADVSKRPPEVPLNAIAAVVDSSQTERTPDSATEFELLDGERRQWETS